ncbi:glucagon receptor-like [Polypterus senegalus]|uniref:glucagon receptor-like n=1 Tax=Polypterus senegalus TaxID=55291 RepID=UPI001962CD7D|nr:glucagon receptor-like [Polypterus senegalus]
MSQVFVLTLLAFSVNIQRLSAEIMEHLLENWKAYSQQCEHKMKTDPPSAGLVCNRTFDRYACWPDGLPNTIVNVSCPDYLPWHDKVKDGLVFLKCEANGTWLKGDKGLLLKNASQCEVYDQEQEKIGRTLTTLNIVYTVGYSLSLAVLSLALAILIGFRKLHCMRNYIHMNLFASFILRAVSILIKDALMNIGVFDRQKDIPAQLNAANESYIGCKIAMVLIHYSMISSFNWLLVEGLYLLNLLVLTVFTEKSYFKMYLCIGWGAPLLFTVPWVIVKYLYENKECWGRNENMAYWWIIRVPIVLAIVINFFIFSRVIMILVSKLRAHQMGYTDYKFRLAKSTLTLIPLLGMHKVVFIAVTDENAHGTLRYIRMFYLLFFNSIQGLLVSILYCFVNKEVQSELVKRWKRWKLGKDIDEEYRHTNSQSGHGKTGSSTMTPYFEKHKLVGSYQNGSGRKDSSLQPAAPQTFPSCPESGCSQGTEPMNLSAQMHCYEFPQETSESSF